MIRVSCPSCQQPHEFLEFYRGLTIFCKKCKAGIQVPKDAESALEAAAPAPPVSPAPPVETPRVPVAESNHVNIAPPVETPPPEQPEAPLNHQFKPAVEPLPPEPLPPEPVLAAPPAKAREMDFEDDEKPSNKRVLILAGILLAILLAGGALVARSMMQGGRGTPIVNVDPNKVEKKKDDENPDVPEKVPPKPIEEPKVEEKKETPVTPPAKPEVAVVSWYTAEDVPLFAPATGRLSLSFDQAEDGYLFLVAKVRLSAKSLGAKKTEVGWSYDLSVEQFLVKSEKGKPETAMGFNYSGGFAQKKDDDFEFQLKRSGKLDAESTEDEIGVLFFVKASDESQFQLQFADFPPVKLDAATRIAAPPAPKVKEPEKKFDDKTPKKEDTTKKIDETPKKIEIAKKPEETPKKIDVPPPDKKKPALTAEPNVELIEWLVSDTLPSSDPDVKRMPLSSSDRLDDNLFVAVKVKLLAKSFTAIKGEVRWNVRLLSKDFSIEGDAPQPFLGRGLEQDGAYGSTIATGYFTQTDLNLPFKEEPDSLVQGVFFTISRDVLKKGGLVLFYRDSAPVSLEVSKQKK